MRRVAISSLLVLLATSSFAAALHEATPFEKLIERYRAALHARHGGASQVPPSHSTPAAMPEIQSDGVRTFNITARQFEFDISPAPFVVNQGDTVTLNVTSADVTHGFLLERYAEGNFNGIPRGTTRTHQFVANTPGTFTFICTISTCGEGHSAMNGIFTVTAQAGLAINGVSPGFGSTVGGTPITITGTNFATGATVTIGGVPARQVSVLNSTTITALTPLGPSNVSSSSAVDVRVTNPDGQVATRIGGFTYTLPQPAIVALSPKVGVVAGGTVVVIAGAGFTTAQTTIVTFGGTPATNVTVVDAMTLRVTAPARSTTGAVDVVVRVGGSSATLGSGFSYQAQPSTARRPGVRH